MEKKLHGKLHGLDKKWKGSGTGPLQLLFQDEARFGRITDPRRCWAPYPMRPLCKAMLTREYIYAYAAINVATGVLDTLIFPYANTECMQLFLDEVAIRHKTKRIVMVVDGAGWHRSKALVVPPNMILLRLPPYSPELNPVELLWHELREKFFGNKIFASLRILENHLSNSLKEFESWKDRNLKTVSWDWIISALFKEN